MIRQGRMNCTIVEQDKTTKIALVSENNRKRRLYREKWALETAKKWNILVPEVIDYNLELWNGKITEVLVLRTIPGKNLVHFSDKVKIVGMKITGKQLSKIGEFSDSFFGWPNYQTLKGEFSTWKDFLLFFSSNYGKRLLNERIITEEELSVIKSLVENIRADFKPKLVHKDIKIENILVGTDGRFYIMDWENSLIGDPLFDLAHYAANYERDVFWSALSEGMGFCNFGNEYVVYEMIALIGVIDFYRKYGFDYRQKRARLRGCLKRRIKT